MHMYMSNMLYYAKIELPNIAITIDTIIKELETGASRAIYFIMCTDLCHPLLLLSNSNNF